jgi:hypothetical protein
VGWGTKRVVKKRRWQGVFDDAGSLIGIIEQVPNGGWFVFVGGRFIGFVRSADTAPELIERMREPEGGES